MPARYSCHVDDLDYNFAHALSLFAVTSKTGEALETRELVLTNAKAPVAEFNLAYIKRPAYKLARALDHTLAHYARAALPFRVHLPDPDAAAIAELTGRGFVRSQDLPCMIMDDSPLGAFALPRLRIRAVDDEASVRDFQQVAFASFGYPAALAPLALTEELAFAPHVSVFVGYLEDRPVCCSALIITGDMAGVYWVGCLDSQRKQGLGAAITAHAVAQGRARACRRACLQASPLGAPVYLRMGFRQTRTYARFDHA